MRKHKTGTTLEDPLAASYLRLAHGSCESGVLRIRDRQDDIVFRGSV